MSQYDVRLVRFGRQRDADGIHVSAVQLLRDGVFHQFFQRTGAAPTREAAVRLIAETVQAVRCWVEAGGKPLVAPFVAINIAADPREPPPDVLDAVMKALEGVDIIHPTAWQRRSVYTFTGSV